MLTNFQRVLLLMCLLCGISRVNAQTYATRNSRTVEVNLTIDRAGMLVNKTNISTATFNIISIESSQDIVNNAFVSMTPEGSYGNDNLDEILYFKPRFGQQQERSFRTANNTLMMHGEANLLPVVSRNGSVLGAPSSYVRTAAEINNNFYWPMTFDFYIKPYSWSSVLKPGTYRNTYKLKVKSTKGNLWAVAPAEMRALYSNGGIEMQEGTLVVNITVLPYMIAFRNANPPVVINVSNLNFFKEGYKPDPALQQSWTVRHNIPFKMHVEVEDPTMDFKPNNIKAQTGNISASNMSVMMQAPELPVKTTVLSTAPEHLAVSTVPSNGVSLMRVDYAVPLEKANSFLQAGSYRLNTTVKMDGVGPGNESAFASAGRLVELIIQPLQNLQVNEKSVTLDFATPSDYSRGVRVVVPNNLTLSSTVPFDIKVKSSASFFRDNKSSISVLPASLLSIGIVSNENSVSPGVVLNEASTSISSRLSALPSVVLDRSYNIQYSIAPHDLLVKAKKGHYTIDVIYQVTSL